MSDNCRNVSEHPIVVALAAAFVVAIGAMLAAVIGTPANAKPVPGEIVRANHQAMLADFLGFDPSALPSFPGVFILGDELLNWVFVQAQAGDIRARDAYQKATVQREWDLLVEYVRVAAEEGTFDSEPRLLLAASVVLGVQGHDEALHLADRAAVHRETAKESIIVKATMFKGANKFQEAIDLLDSRYAELVNAEPEVAVAYYACRAISCSGKGDNTQAIRDFRRAIDLAKQYPHLLGYDVVACQLALANTILVMENKGESEYAEVRLLLDEAETGLTGFPRPHPLRARFSTLMGRYHVSGEQMPHFDPDAATRCVASAASEYRELEYFARLGLTESLLGTINLAQDQNEAAYECFERALRSFRANNQIVKQAEALANMAIAKSNMAGDAFKHGDLCHASRWVAEAISLADRSIGLFREANAHVPADRVRRMREGFELWVERNRTQLYPHPNDPE